MNRRRFLKILAGATAWPWMNNLAVPRSVLGQGLEVDDADRSPENFVFAQLQYRGGSWDPHPLAYPTLLQEVMDRTSVEADLQRKILRPGDPQIFSYPFLYLAGAEAFEPFSQEERALLRRFLESGGFLLADDAAGVAESGFDASFREEMRNLFPQIDLQRLSSNHTVFRTFYLVKQVAGRQIVRPYLEGITIGDVTPVIYARNDLGGAWERDLAGHWLYPCEPGGEPQRREAFKLGVNLVLYTLTATYKDDDIHTPFIRRRVG